MRYSIQQIYTDSFLGVGYDYKIERYKDGAQLH